jgi:hypothetical protein
MAAEGRPNGPRVSDSLRPGPGAPAERQLSPAAVLLANFIAAMNAADGDAEPRYRSALEALRKRADEVVVEIARAEGRCEETDYPTRWALVHAAAQLRHPSALAFLRTLVLTPIPAERSPDPHSFSSVAEETILRTTAVEGVGALAADGDKNALAALLEFLDIPSRSVRRAAIQSVYAAPRGRRLRKRMEAALPASQHFLLDIQPIEVGQAPQVKRPPRHLSPAGRKSKAPAPPGLGDDEGRQPSAPSPPPRREA